MNMKEPFICPDCGRAWDPYDYYDWCPVCEKEREHKWNEIVPSRRRNGYLEVFEPCDHPGCANHVSHPCEKCGHIHKTRKPLK